MSTSTWVSKRRRLRWGVGYSWEAGVAWMVSFELLLLLLIGPLLVILKSKGVPPLCKHGVISMGAGLLLNISFLWDVNQGLLAIHFSWVFKVGLCFDRHRILIPQDELLCFQDCLPINVRERLLELLQLAVDSLASCWLWVFAANSIDDEFLFLLRLLTLRRVELLHEVGFNGLSIV